MNPSLLIAATTGLFDHRLPAPPGLPLPEFWFEDGFGSTPAHVDDPLWDEPNTFPQIILDVRGVFNADGSVGLIGPPGGPYADTPAEVAASVVGRLDFFRNNVTWPSSKPWRYKLIVKGFDSVDAGWFVARAPEDLAYAGQPSVWHDTAISNSRPFMQAAWAAVKTALDATSHGYPEGLVTDVESYGDAQGAAGTLYPAMQADSRYADAGHLFNGTQTLSAWHAAHLTDRSGAAIPAFNGGHNGYHPVNFDYTDRCVGGILIGYRYALERIIYGPFRDVFGQRRCGEWEIITGTKASPVRMRPQQSHYSYDGFLGGADQARCTLHPQNYSAPDPWRGFDPTLDADDARWETGGNWEQVYGVGPGTEGDRTGRLARLVGRDLVSDLRACCPAAQIIPAVSTRFIGRDGSGTLAGDAAAQKASYQPVLVGYMRDCMERGATGFWLWEPFWTDPTSPDRAAVLNYVRAANAAVAT